MFLRKCLLPVAVLFSVSMYSQKASEVLEKGIVIKPGQKIFLEYTDKKLLYDITDGVLFDFTPLGDSSFFLPAGKGVNVYIKPLNPLRYSTPVKIEFKDDPITKEAADVMGKIAELFTKVGVAPTPDPDSDSISCSKFKIIKDSLIKLSERLKKDKTEEIAQLFESLKNISFDNESTTTEEIKSAKEEYAKIEQYYAGINKSIEVTQENLKLYEDCQQTDEVDPFVGAYIFTQVIKELKTLYQQQKTQMEKLKAPIASIEATRKEALKNRYGNYWFLFLGVVSEKDLQDKIASFSLTINQDGYKLNDSKEIVKAEKVAEMTRSFRMRKFQRFVTEVSGGVAYTNIKFQKFATETDALGKQRVADAGEEKFKKISFTAMVNFNYFIPASPVHPFFQLGIGANADYPTFFMGGGIRLNVALRRIAIGGGFASTWTKKLNKLKIGDEVSGAAELEKDLKHEFNFPLKPYFGIQYNF